MPNKTQKKRGRRYAAHIGGLFVVLAVIGVITVIVASIRFTVSFLDNDRDKLMFADIIRPVAMFNPSPFESPADIDMTQLLQYSMWATIKSDKRASYESGEQPELIVPATDLDMAAGRLFGPEITLVHQSFGIDIENRYDYDEKNGVYTVPIAAQLLVYSPEVVEITKDGDMLNLLVAYIPPADAFTDSDGPKPDKYMIFVMRMEDGNYHIDKVRDVPKDQEHAPEGVPQTNGNIRP